MLALVREEKGERVSLGREERGLIKTAIKKKGERVS